MEESKNRLLEGINFHDANVADIVFEGEKVVFDIPRGLVNDNISFEERHPCKLVFTPDDEPDVYLSRQSYSFGRVRYKSVLLTLEELRKRLKKYQKKNGFEKIGLGFGIIDWVIRDDEVILKCDMGFRRPLLLIIFTRDMQFIESEFFIDKDKYAI